MKVEQVTWSSGKGWTPAAPGALGSEAQLVLMFGSRAVCHEKAVLESIRTAYPKAHLCGCTTAGEIADILVRDDTLTLTAVRFDKTRIEGATMAINTMDESFDVGKRLAQSFAPEGLRHLFVLSDGLSVNGSELVKGLTEALPTGVSVTGGLAADGARFQETHVCWDAEPVSRMVAAIAFYGDGLKIGYGSVGGWDSFGPDRIVTCAKGNILYAMDGQSALELYKRYLGEHANGLPATGLLFPLLVRSGAKLSDPGTVRTILGINEQEQSLIFAGDVPEGSHARLMKANLDRLIDGATEAAKNSLAMMAGSAVGLAILISCVGRRLILKQRVEEEVEGVRDVLGNQAVLTGFYSYGEIAPFEPGKVSELHNQTMTITTFSEQA